MSKVYTNPQYYTAIAAAIREKNGTSTQYKPNAMAAAIAAISGGDISHIVVDAPLGSLLTCGTESYQLTGTETRHVFDVEDLGTYTVTATVSGFSDSESITVSDYTGYYCKLSPSYFPSAYQELEYITATGTQYIDTGVPGADDITIDLIYMPSEGYTGEYPVTGTAWSASAMFFMVYTSLWRYHTHGTAVNDGTASTSKFTVITLTTASFSIDGTSYSVSGSASNSTNNFFIFWTGDSPSYSKGRGAIKRYKITKAGTLTRDFVPCYRKSDGVVGMYDMVTSTFFTNAGTGNFIAGPKAEAYIESKTITQNGLYTAPTGVDGYNPVTVNVPSASCVITQTSEGAKTYTITGVPL